jgi:hypothetical protein
MTLRSIYATCPRIRMPRKPCDLGDILSLSHLLRSLVTWATHTRIRTSAYSLRLGAITKEELKPLAVRNYDLLIAVHTETGLADQSYIRQVAQPLIRYNRQPRQRQLPIWLASSPPLLPLSLSLCLSKRGMSTTRLYDPMSPPPSCSPFEVCVSRRLTVPAPSFPRALLIVTWNGG